MTEIDAVNIQIIGCIEDAIDKLQISGQIIPLTYEMKLNINIFKIYKILF